MLISDTSRALNVRRFGSGTETVVLAHGFGSDQGTWKRLIPALWRYRVVVYDLAGSGSADPAYFDLRQHGDLEGHADDLIRILAEQQIDTCTVVGHSVSGVIALLAAIRRPDLFNKLILVGTSARYTDDVGYSGGLDPAHLQHTFTQIVSNFRDFALATCPGMVGKPIDHPATQSFLESVLRMRPDLVLSMAKAIFLSDYRDRLHECTVPVAILQTEHDLAVPLEAAKYLHEHLAKSTFEIIPAEGHHPHVTSPDLFAAALRRHLPLMDAELPA
jgi:pimeloyl-ACP methyl ester carboxylesterase